jgi:signal transduction histidine kinase
MMQDALRDCESHPYTLFASPERASAERIAGQHAAFTGASPLVVDTLDAIPDIVLVLNQHRQIVFANRALLEYLNCAAADVLGLRPGEALDCIHAADEEWGCGTSEFCRMCGAAKAVLQGLAGETAVQECRVTRRPNPADSSRESLDLRVHAAPLKFDGQDWVQFVLTDISHEKRRRSLETIFFHDVLNTATAVRAAADLIARRLSGSGVAGGLDGVPIHLQGLAHRLIDEITAQRLLSDAENDELLTKLEHVNASRLLLELAESTSGAEGSHGRKLRIDLPELAPALNVDATLLRRVLGNMLKNAVEATPAGGTITVGCIDRGTEVEFWMNNPGEIPRHVQLQIFQRSFTTKGAGRGLGTYSMRLLTERYLGGRVNFTSSAAEGVTFRASYPKNTGRGH